MENSLSWGEPKIEICSSVDGAPGPEPGWKAIDTPVKDSTQLTPKEGTDREAKDEGDNLVDSMPGKTNYDFVWDSFVKKGAEPPLEDENGIVSGEHAIRLTPEDPTCKGIQIDRCRIKASITYKSNDGIKIHYVAKCLKPKSGNTVKIQVNA